MDLDASAPNGGDGGFIDSDGYVYVMGRTDDVLNVAGHRLSTGSIEAALAGLPIVSVDHELNLVIEAGVNGEFTRPTPASLAAGLLRQGVTMPGRHR